MVILVKIENDMPVWNSWRTYWQYNNEEDPPKLLYRYCTLSTWKCKKIGCMNMYDYNYGMTNYKSLVSRSKFRKKWYDEREIQHKLCLLFQSCFSKKKQSSSFFKIL